MKIINITGKGFKKELLISSKDVSTLYYFIKEVIKSEVMIINTNIGLDVYYHGIQDQKGLIVNSFLLLVACKGKATDDYFIKSLNSEVAIKKETQVFFEKLIKNPLLFKSYSKSLFNQLNLSYKTNQGLIDELLLLWKSELFDQNTHDKVWRILMPYIIKLQGSHFEISNPILKQLIKESLSAERCN